MSKDFVVKVYKVFAVALVIIIALLAIVMFVFIDGAKSVAVGLFAGVIIGGFIKIKFVLDKRFKDMDERAVTIFTLSQMIGQSAFAMVAFLAFVFTALGIISVKDESEFVIYCFGMGIITVMFEKISNFVLNKKL